MADEKYTPKPNVILNAGVEGEHAESRGRIVTNYWEMIEPLVEKHRGRVMDSLGDHLHANFSGVLDAVRCAKEIQEEMKAINAQLPENRRMKLRVGINLERTE